MAENDDINAEKEIQESVPTYSDSNFQLELRPLEIKLKTIYDVFTKNGTEEEHDFHNEFDENKSSDCREM